MESDNMLFPKVGDKVLVAGHGWREFEIKDIAILNSDKTSSTLANGGSVKFKVDIDGLLEWIHIDAITTTESIKTSTLIVPENTDMDATFIGKKMTDWMVGLKNQPDNSKLPEIVTLLMAIQYDKEKYYGSSWKGKGEIRGIMANLDRKYDRLDKMTNDEIEGVLEGLAVLEKKLALDELTPEQVGESKIDAIADLTCYGILYMTYVKDNFPNAFKIWVDKNVPNYLKDKMLFLQQ
ncbi:hypothetical protein SHANETTE_162 [Bacillus phage Shanette]|uniref:DNA replication protein n=2 Tax=Siminovitchvirus TaxID=1918721 RepID=S5M8T1_9CAUD|nr:replication protein [Bacillus phage JL]YP_009216157.1 replication protein [Bacillus phage Shanette]AGR46913.1 DNA replication protein [Bacillus phage JL]AGR47056.1 hypothetical protein SHANETTE_162 [Bacillus phage Shanette]